MIRPDDVFETKSMIKYQNLDVRTLTMGISLLDCADEDVDKFNEKIYHKITSMAKDLVKIADEIESEFGVPIINKRISITPIAIAAASCKTDSYVSIAKTLDKAAKKVGVDFIGGFSALVDKGSSKSDQILMKSLAKSLADRKSVV